MESVINKAKQNRRTKIHSIKDEEKHTKLKCFSQFTLNVQKEEEKAMAAVHNMFPFLQLLSLVYCILFSIGFDCTGPGKGVSGGYVNNGLS